MEITNMLVSGHGLEKFAKSFGVDLTQLDGTGPTQRVGKTPYIKLPPVVPFTKRSLSKHAGHPLKNSDSL
jgi:hypothetical protein